MCQAATTCQSMRMEFPRVCQGLGGTEGRRCNPEKMSRLHGMNFPTTTFSWAILIKLPESLNHQLRTNMFAPLVGRRLVLHPLLSRQRPLKFKLSFLNVTQRLLHYSSEITNSKEGGHAICSKVPLAKWPFSFAAASALLFQGISKFRRQTNVKQNALWFVSWQRWQNCKM